MNDNDKPVIKRQHHTPRKSTPDCRRRANNRSATLRKYAIRLGLLFIVGIALFFIHPLTVNTARSAIIRIPRGATIVNVRDSLSKYFGDEYASTVTRFMTDDTQKLALRYGAYEIREGTSALKGARILSRGAETPFNITINGVRNLDSFLPLIAAKFDFTADSLHSELKKVATLQRYNLSDTAQIPVIFLNDTYSFYWTATPRMVIDKIAANYTGFWTDGRRAKAAALGVTPVQMGIIASIVDEETNNADEKGIVGRLYINRLRKGMRLQADPTVRFAANDFSIRRVTGKHLAIESDYNTYKINGLPPGPIRTTSKATLQAILDAPDVDYLYMCAKEDLSGTHNFATTYEEHQRNAARYRHTLDSLGIK